MDRATALGWLPILQNALMQLAAGQKAVAVAYEGKSVSYSQADKALLAGTIYELQRYLGISGPRRALVPWFAR